MVKKQCKASLTVEATLAFPIFFFAVLVFLYLFQILYVQEHIQFALAETVEKASEYAYPYENLFSAKESESVEGMRVGGEWVGNVAAGGFLTALFFERVDTDMLDGSCIQGGSAGIHLLRSRVRKEEEEVDAVAEYQINIQVPILSRVSFPVCQRIKGRAFVGSSYDTKGGKEKNETMVYVTPTGTAYHHSRDCTYLRIVLKKERYRNVASLRNDGGGKYYACERCVHANVPSQETVYYTSYGTRFHTLEGCPAIKRSVTAIPFSQVGGRHACSKCAK